MKQLLSVVAASLSLAACAPTINPAMQQRTDAMVAQYSGNRRTIPAAGAFQVKPWAAGQYVVIRTTYEGKPAVQRMRILRADREGIVLENDIQDYHGHTVHELTFRRQPRTAEEARDAIVRLVVRMDGQEPQVYDFQDPNNPTAAMMRDAMQSAWQSLVYTVDTGAPRESVSVPAGAFEGATRMRTTLSVLGITQHSEGHVHPAVPINGGVSSRSTDGKSTYELLDFGTNGSR